MSAETNKAAVAERVLASEPRAIAQAISLCENGQQSQAANQLMAELWPHTGHAATIGITGPPGVGKSTLTSGLIKYLREQDQTVGVIAVDPSSSISNGALLGDRIRMMDHVLDDGVFIRSMSTRGHLGGAAEATFPAMTILDAAGMDVVIIETVGVGQSETEVRSLVDTLTVVMQPDSGDSVQLLKSGLLEVPDILCLNKNDHPGAQAAKRNLKGLTTSTDDSLPLFVETNALEGDGIANLWAAIQQQRELLGAAGLRERRRDNLSQVLASLATARLIEPVAQKLRAQAGNELLDQLESREINPMEAIYQLIG